MTCGKWTIRLVSVAVVYPNAIFTVVIWGSDRPKFGDPEEEYLSKRICVTGKVSDYKGVPEIVAYGPSQIKIQ
jgi:hypothetical protein